MYYVMLCLSSPDQDRAILSHKPDHPFRSWVGGARFLDEPGPFPYKGEPTEPIRARIVAGDEGMMAEFWDSPVSLMTKTFCHTLRAAGVDNIDTYDAEIVEEASGKTYEDYVAFNIVGTIAAADLDASSHDATTGPLVSKDFHSLEIDEGKAGGMLLFRLAESVNAILVHERVKEHIESSGIATLTFIQPKDWAG